MERRFLSVFDQLAHRQTRGEPWLSILRASPNDELVAALAVAGKEDPVAANAIATELLNRLRRAPFLGAAAVSLTTLVAIYLLDYIYTGTFLLLDTSPRANILAGISFVILLLSVILFLMWRGYFRSLRMLLLSRGRSF